MRKRKNLETAQLADFNAAVDTTVGTAGVVHGMMRASLIQDWQEPHS
jgi:hypothetical protein